MGHVTAYVFYHGILSTVHTQTRGVDFVIEIDDLL